MKSLALIIFTLINTIDLHAQNKSQSLSTREITINNHQLLTELRNNLTASQKGIYLCSIVKQEEKIYYKLNEVGFISELKESPSSLYAIVNNNVIFFRTNVEDIVEHEKFFQKVVLPLTKGRIINDLLPNGTKNPDVVPYGGYDPIDITIILEKGKVRVIKEAQP